MVTLRLLRGWGGFVIWRPRTGVISGIGLPWSSNRFKVGREFADGPGLEEIERKTSVVGATALYFEDVITDLILLSLNFCLSRCKLFPLSLFELGYNGHFHVIDPSSFWGFDKKCGFHERKFLDFQAVVYTETAANGGRVDSVKLAELLA
jgi:hypothetical protein